MKKTLALFIALCIVITTFGACGVFGQNLAPNLPQAVETPSIGETPRDAYIPRDGRLRIAYQPNDSFNPFTASSRDNLAVIGLMYESLFLLGEDFTAINELAVGITTLDGRNFTIEIAAGIVFHDGTALTVHDVIYSLNRARESDLYQSRLRIIDSHRLVQTIEGETNPYVFEIELNRVHGNLPVLLTFPIIQAGTSNRRIPPGTGPFSYLEEEGFARLVAHAYHPRFTELPIDTIYLGHMYTVDQMTAYFNSGHLDIVYIDLQGPEPHFAATREMRQFHTSMFDFVGFNIHRPYTGRIEVRTAIQFAIDREYIANSILRGTVIATPLPMHPALSFYDMELSLAHRFDLEHARAILHGEADAYETYPHDAEDINEAEYEEENAETEPASQTPQLRLIVAQGNVARIEAAVYIAANIAALGFQVIVDDLPPNEFLAALESGDFDLFYGQVRLQPDFDLWELLGGSLSFGGMGLLINPLFIENFIASGQSGRQQAATNLNAAILQVAPFVSIGFRHEYVFTQRGVVSNLNPTQERVYRDVFDWILDL